jgi:hypothetical protein
MTLVFGTDPEFFAYYKKEGKNYVLPAVYFRKYLGVPYFPDEKHPVFLDAWKDLGIIVMEDGVAFEQTILPSTNWKEVFERILKGNELLSKHILSKFPEHCEPDVLTVPTINYEVDRWKKEGKDFKLSVIFGCDADKDADNPDYNSPIINALKHPYRYGGGHIAISGSEKIKEEPIWAIQSLKMTAGLCYIGFSSLPELDKERVSLYGKPAKYRVQNYGKLFENIPHTDVGIEYRTPSNLWTSSYEFAQRIFNWAEIGIKELLERNLVYELYKEIGKTSAEAIVNCDQKLALELLDYVESKL